MNQNNSCFSASFKLRHVARNFKGGEPEFYTGTFLGKYTAQTPTTRAAASTRVVNYSNFRLRLQISISGCSFLQSVDELLEFMETWGIRSTCSLLARTEED